ncbi:pentapeptide repeat-containing protein [Bradyrhizobium sp. 172]|uniref:pentapeptide repeat-containing protein n=1 Tax=Bradyrhizobium sp. 172 TaxID=2782643 RepID=UPI001FFFEBC1|nr:pentapeptide repeat-containing protein [Bradyrhizobium sp. 172]UPJ96273.1 pentapeptide repeat-containing protein [Bradyrhizobium sp. 172]
MPLSEGSADQEPFSSLAELRQQNSALLKQWRLRRQDQAKEPDIAAARELIDRSIATGAILKELSDRDDAQEIVDYWIAQILSAAPTERLSAHKTIDEFKRLPSEGLTPTSSAQQEYSSAREQTRISALARQYYKSNRERGYLLEGQALTDAKRYAQRDTEIANFVNESENYEKKKQRVRRLIKIVFWIPVLILLSAVALLSVLLWSAERFSQSLVARVKNPTESVDHKNLSIQFLALLQRVAPPYDFSGKEFVDLSFRGARLVAPNFTQSTLNRVNLKQSQLYGSSFIGAQLQEVAFDGAKLTFGQFRGADLNNVSFSGAELYRADFEDADLCNVDFSRADLRGTYLRDVRFDRKFEPKRFLNTAWWLALGWTRKELEDLMRINVSMDVLESSAAFQNDRHRQIEEVNSAAGNAIARADALNGFAWILATWGLQLSALNAQPLKSSLPNGSLWTPGASPDCKQDGSTDTSNALGAVKVAICILTGEKQNLGEASYKEKLANYTDTYAYLLMQLGQAESAVEVLKPLDIKDDTATQFRYAAAAFSLGKEYEKVGLSVLKSSLSNQDQPYIPSHEVYQLRRLIAGEFYKELYSSIDKAHPQKESHCPN